MVGRSAPGWIRYAHEWVRCHASGRTRGAYGQTVNVASRIGEYARPGEVLVSQEVVDACSEALVSFREICPVKLKGVPIAVRLHAAQRAG
jgi:class 3 adenylate cyclase